MFFLELLLLESYYGLHFIFFLLRKKYTTLGYKDDMKM